MAEEAEVAAIKLVCLTCPKAIELAQHPSSDHAIAMPDSGVGALLMLKFIQIFGRRLCTLIVLLAFNGIDSLTWLSLKEHKRNCGHFTTTSSEDPIQGATLPLVCPQLIIQHHVDLLSSPPLLLS